MNTKTQDNSKNFSLMSTQMNLTENPNSSVPIINTHLTKEGKKNLEKNNISDISIILKEIPLHNLNDFYSIETNVFKKRIEKLNLQFFWIYESILEVQNLSNENNTNNNSKQDLIFPYNKLFLILFKEISLYIEEIIRLNKQLNAKNKNEKFFLNKLNDYKSKEKEYYLNKQIIKTLQRTIRNLEKSNEKLKNENEKLNKKLFNARYSHNNNNSINHQGFGVTINNNVNNYRYKNYQKANTIYNEYYGFNTNLTEQGSLLSSNSNKFSFRTYINKSKEKNLNINKSPSKDFLHIINNDMNKLINSCSRLYEKNDNDKFSENNEINEDNKNILYLSINQCQDEINNLSIIENLLLNNNQSESKTFNKERNKSFNNLLNTPINYKINNRQNDVSNNKKMLFTDKRYKKINKSIEFRINVIKNKNKS